MGTLLGRNEGIARRIGDLGPVADRIASVLEEGKREQLLSGADADGVPFAPLAAATLRDPRRGPGGPLVPDEGASALIVHYEVTVSAGPGRLEIRAGWPFGFVRYLRSGTRRMPRRDPGGFRAEDKARLMALLKGHVDGSG